AQTGTASGTHRSLHRSYGTAVQNNKYLLILSCRTSMRNGGTCSHTEPHQFPEQQTAPHPGTFLPSYRRSGRSPSDPSDGRRFRSSWSSDLLPDPAPAEALSCFSLSLF